ncbi:putative aliphatic sulfonates transporter substrate-binding protein [Nocardia nova SH22a]|uniref:Putative aliphatic sulfonates transporter substrate-binding protein n=1 Tax=Nocardia nova SH22a TaxID=1415166 RepID=W5TKX0_9NOCA|nr:ABC transporter substrate-binding protein [Nocardia nova]AHH19623.1 putative aliphatic sulfonates transporter substrate-binding protein [Nocardia nova SH22a]
MTVRVGYFPHNNSLFVLRHRGILERALPEVEWVDLRALPQPPRADVKTALPSVHSDHLFTEGGYDFIGTGFTPPITALGNDRDIVYVGISEPRVENGRLVTEAGNGIESVADLAGKRVGIAHGSWQTTLLLFALDRAGLGWADIEPVDTDVHDGGALLLDGALDAWVGAYPGLAAVEAATSLHTLVDTASVFSHPSLWFTRRDFAENNRPALEAIITALRESDAWIAANPRAAAQYFVDDVAARGGAADLDAWEAALRGRPFGIGPVTGEFLDEQQRAADLLAANGLLPKAIRVRDAVDPSIDAFVAGSPSVAAG